MCGRGGSERRRGNDKYRWYLWRVFNDRSVSIASEIHLGMRNARANEADADLPDVQVAWSLARSCDKLREVVAMTWRYAMDILTLLTIGAFWSSLIFDLTHGGR